MTFMVKKSEQDTSVKGGGGKLGLPLLPSFTLVSCSAYSTLKIDAICASEMATDFQRITRRCIPEDS
jgi:hypothetical protein